MVVGAVVSSPTGMSTVLYRSPSSLRLLRVSSHMGPRPRDGALDGTPVGDCEGALLVMVSAGSSAVDEAVGRRLPLLGLAVGTRVGVGLEAEPVGEACEPWRADGATAWTSDSANPTNWNPTNGTDR